LRLETAYNREGKALVKHVISLGLFLFILWLGMSGHYNPLLLILGVISTVLTVNLAVRMDLIDHESYPLHLSQSLFLRFLSYQRL